MPLPKGMPKVFEEAQQPAVWVRTEWGEDLVVVAVVRTGEAAVATAMVVQAEADLVVVAVVQEDTVEKLFAGLIGL